MLKIFREIRYNLMKKNKTGRYLKYAIGEIILVVIGILIALQVNNLNEQSKSNKLLYTYTQNTISELKKDLIVLSSLDSINRIAIINIENYIVYYNSEAMSINILKTKADTLMSQMNFFPFSTNTYSVQDLFATGNLKLFPSHQKNGIIKYKNEQEKVLFAQSKTTDIVVEKFHEYEKDIDILFTSGFSNREHVKVKNWQYDITSSQFRKQNNYIASFLEFFQIQKSIIEHLKKETIELQNVLEQK